jgi:hypothetical protein
MASWIIRHKETGQPIFETFRAETAKRAHGFAGEYEAVEAAVHLRELNTPGTPAYSYARAEA